MVKATYERVRRLPGVGKLAERLAQSFSQDYVHSVRHQLNQISPSMCAAKWLQSTIHLEIGETHSCHHPPRHKVPESELAANPGALHNTEHKKRERKKMLQGIRPEECSYCWKAEDAGANLLSDRHYKSAEDWARSSLPQLAKATGDENIDPTYLELSFSSTCQLKCSYCDPAVSSALRAEIRQYGAYPTSDNFGNLENFQESTQATDAFWKWWPEVRSKLQVLRLTGGEPLLLEDSFRLMESFLADPLPGLKFSLNTNLMLSDERFTRFRELLKRLSTARALKEFHLYASIDTWGEQAEWLRSGLSVKTFSRHLELVLRETPEIPVTLLVKFNALSPFKFIELLDYVLWCRKTYPKAQLKVGVSLLHYPHFMALPVLPRRYGPLLDEIVAHYEANSMALRGSVGFSPSEIERFKRIVEQWKKTPTAQHEWDNLQRFVVEHDRRKGTSFDLAFPEFWQGLQ